MRVEIDKKDLQGKVDELLHKIGERIAEVAREEIVKKNAIATGLLLKSIKVVKRSWKEYEVGSDCPYAPFVEYGTEPHRPPFEAIYNWVRVKIGGTEEEARKIAWKIVKKIEKEGTDPKPFLIPAVMEVFTENVRHS